MLKYLYHRPTIGQAVQEMMKEFIQVVEGDGEAALIQLAKSAKQDADREARDRRST